MRPLRHEVFTTPQTVQEQDEYASSALLVPDFQGAPTDAAPTLDCRFSQLYAPAGGFQVWGPPQSRPGGSLATKLATVSSCALPSECSAKPIDAIRAGQLSCTARLTHFLL
jgi:hypothetical protein